MACASSKQFETETKMISSNIRLALAALALSGAAGLSAVPLPASAESVNQKTIVVAHAGQWYAIGGAFRSRNNAQRRATQLGEDYWVPMLGNRCPNFTPDLWLVVTGPYHRDRAEAFASGAPHVGAYAKNCY